MSENKYPIGGYALLPADDAVQNWFEENIDKECSASSAIYKFRLWLESLQPKPAGARWVKASERLPTTGLIVWRWLDKTEAYTGYKEKGGFHFGTGGARVDPTYYSEIEWLDESGAGGNDAIEFAEWCAFNYQRDFEPLDSSLPINERKYRQFWIDNDQTEYTTTDLYNIWQQSKSK